MSGMEPMLIGAALGGRNVNPYGAQAQYQAGASAANRLYGAQQSAIATQLAGQQSGSLGEKVKSIELRKSLLF